MDELRSKRRVMRRLLLAVAICSTGTLPCTTATAIEPAKSDSTPFRNLLLEGWNSTSPESKITFQGPQPVERNTPTLCSPTQIPQLQPVLTGDDFNRDGFAKLIRSSADQRRLIKGKPAQESVGKLASSITKPLSTESKSILVHDPLRSDGSPISLAPQVITNPLPETTPLPETSPLPEPESILPEPESILPEPESKLPEPVAVSITTDDATATVLRGAARRRGFGMLAIDQIGDPILPGRPTAPDATLTQTIHANKLLQLAREQLAEASDRMRRQANHSAKKLTLQALRNVVTMKDVQSGGNHHAKRFESALEAIRESQDFTGKFGPVDQTALLRLVTVHETNALKDVELEDVSSLRATEMYLAVARENLIAATHSVREASDALVLMGQIEMSLADETDMHGAALAVTLQRAAIEVDPSNAIGFYELGSTLLSQGLADEAFQALSRSALLQPNRSTYEKLLKAARQVGDANTAQQCIAALRNPKLSRHVPIKRLQPRAFAATYRPNNTAIARNVKSNAS